MYHFDLHLWQRKLSTGSPVIILSAGLLLQAPCGAQSVTDRVQLQLNTQEAEAVLAILNKRANVDSIEQSDWQRLFEAEPYIRLKSREAGRRRSFTDAEFQRFVLSDSLMAGAPILERNLRDWKAADVTAAAARAIAYLPREATIRAKLFPVIKPQTNSFVYELLIDPAIVLYLDPQLNAGQFENAVAHELHHVGYASVAERFSAAIADLPPSAHTAAEWIGAFGEGFAMLAAVGGPDVHPHAVSPPEDRARWDRDVAHFARDLVRLDKFFRDIVDGSLATADTIQQVAMRCMGVQGPWYTVGWKMAVLIEKHFGRATLISCMLDPRMLLSTYNSAAAREGVAGESLPPWSPQLLHSIGARGAPFRP
ncbi:MAG TPA: DUF5700 domain-containing putative Zn-dependent protease [Longimicrobiales bacterium]|nr:DUF5700 domain-containing putative Zn-dependent protease [Longimicrobiales bacterium]